jgi:transposase-like protein
MIKKFDQFNLIPPYCPNSLCLFHFGTETTFFVKNGWTKTDKAPFRNQRYKCKRCKIQFSNNTFGLDFRKRVVDLSENVLHYSMNGMSNNSIARLLNIAEGTVRNRLGAMAKQSVLFEQERAPQKLNEDVAYDGFETFTYSQFSPCYVNTVVGSHSMFIYFNTFSPLNRKGRMTEEQKTKNQDLIKKYGLYPQSSVFEESWFIMRELSQMGEGKTLYTDEHKSYYRAYHSFDCRMQHETINSQVKRDPSNPLFPINRLHGLYRHHFSSQQRETISFQKHEGALLEKIQLMKTYRNYMNPKFVKKNKFDPHAHDWSPAMYVKAATKILGFKEVFGVRKLKTQMKLNSRDEALIKRSYPFSRQKIVA